MDNRAAWSAAGGVVIVVSGTNAVAWAAASAPAHSPLPVWPAIAFAAIAVGGLYVVIAPLLRVWPFGRLRSVTELLDDYIRRGRDARERIVREQLEPLEAAGVVAEWALRAANGLHDRFPAIADEFLLAAGNDQVFSGQVLQIQTINAKMDVLGKARKGLGGT